MTEMETRAKLAAELFKAGWDAAVNVINVGRDLKPAIKVGQYTIEQQADGSFWIQCQNSGFQCKAEVLEGCLSQLCALYAVSE